MSKRDMILESLQMIKEGKEVDIKDLRKKIKNTDFFKETQHKSISKVVRKSGNDILISTMGLKGNVKDTIVNKDILKLLDELGIKYHSWKGEGTNIVIPKNQ